MKQQQQQQQQQQINKWLNFSFKNTNINNDNIQISILIPSGLAFTQEIIKPMLEKGIINENTRINIIAKAFNGVTYKSITTLQTLEIKDIISRNFTNIMLGFYNTLHADNYVAEDFKELIFNYRVLSNNFIPDIKTKTLTVEDHINYKEKEFNHKISNVNIPMSMDLYQ
jgi:hypothetical protein